MHFGDTLYMLYRPRTGGLTILKSWVIHRARITFLMQFLLPQLPAQKHSLSKNTDVDLPPFKYHRVPKAQNLHISLLSVQYAQWEKFVIGVVAVGEI